MAKLNIKCLTKNNGCVCEHCYYTVCNDTQIIEINCDKYDNDKEVNKCALSTIIKGGKKWKSGKKNS